MDMWGEIKTLHWIKAGVRNRRHSKSVTKKQTAVVRTCFKVLRKDDNDWV